MKKNAGLVALALAVVFGILAVFLVNRWMSARTGQVPVVTQDTVPLTKVVVAAKDLDIGTPLTAQTLTLVDWPRNAVPQGAFNDIKQVEGRVAVTRLFTGSPVLAAELAAPGSGAGMVALIPQGKRAMALRVDEVTGVGGFVLPNTYVDIISVETENNERKTVKTILQRIKVLAIAQETFTEEGKAKIVRTVTLEMAPEEVEKLALQTHKGAIHLALRNPLDEDQRIEADPEVKAPVVRQGKRRAYRPVSRNVEVIRAGESQQVKVPF
ncbi:MAG: Flp pilus assembly protein CpaB [Desulfuromonadaceae bacterium]|nr:Flp pilus assembly protein CpaB [Desulfuromonadaceae bacterium]